VAESGITEVAGGGVGVYGAAFTMSGNAVVSGNTVKVRGGDDSTAWGGGVYVSYDATFTMEGGVIDGNNSDADVAYSRDDIFVYLGGIFIKTGGVIPGYE
jgi:hypothetical protein